MNILVLYKNAMNVGLQPKVTMVTKIALVTFVN